MAPERAVVVALGLAAMLLAGTTTLAQAPPRGAGVSPPEAAPASKPEAGAARSDAPAAKAAAPPPGASFQASPVGPAAQIVPLGIGGTGQFGTAWYLDLRINQVIACTIVGSDQTLRCVRSEMIR